MATANRFSGEFNETSKLVDRIALVGALEAYSNVKTDLEPLSLSIQQKALPTDHARLQAVPGGKRIAASERRRVEQSEANSVCEM